MFGGSGEALLGEYAVVLNGKGAAPGKRAVALNSGLAEGDRSFAAGNFVHTKAVNSRVNGSECFIDEGADASSADGYKNYVSGRASHGLALFYLTTIKKFGLVNLYMFLILME